MGSGREGPCRSRSLSRGLRELDVDVGNGLHLHVVSSGTGRPVVLLHGFTGSAETWAPLRASLEGRFAVHAVELPGHGRSSAPADPARYALDRFADDLPRVLDALGVERTSILGYSLGGRAALRFVLAHPLRAESLILESASPGNLDEAERAERRARDLALADGIERDGIAAFVDRWERLPLWESQATLPPGVRAALRAQRLGNSPQALANSLRGAGAAADAPVVDRLPTMAVPTLVIAGALDAKYAGFGRLMERVIPRVRLAVVEGAGHAVHLERPDLFAALVAEFLDALR